MAEVKFCGLTRAADAAFAASLGAAYLGVIFAGGPRLRTAAEARAIFEGAPRSGPVRRVGVFGSQPLPEILAIAAEAELHIVQLHGGATPEMIAALRDAFTGDIWRVLRARAGGGMPIGALREASAGADGVVLDALVDGRLGGTGVTLDWHAVAAALEADGRPARLVLAGGLTAANIGVAVRLVAPEVVDVSSGVESAPGIKDHGRMRAFFDAAQGRGG